MEWQTNGSKSDVQDALATGELHTNEGDMATKRVGDVILVSRRGGTRLKTSHVVRALLVWISS
jgi:hypothetical protein